MNSSWEVNPDPFRNFPWDNAISLWLLLLPFSHSQGQGHTPHAWCEPISVLFPERADRIHQDQEHPLWDHPENPWHAWPPTSHFWLKVGCFPTPWIYEPPPGRWHQLNPTVCPLEWLRKGGDTFQLHSHFLKLSRSVFTSLEVLKAGVDGFWSNLRSWKVAMEGFGVGWALRSLLTPWVCKKSLSQENLEEPDPAGQNLVGMGISSLNQLGIVHPLPCENTDPLPAGVSRILLAKVAWNPHRFPQVAWLDVAWNPHKFPYPFFCSIICGYDWKRKTPWRYPWKLSHRTHFWWKERKKTMR